MLVVKVHVSWSSRCHEHSASQHQRLLRSHDSSHQQCVCLWPLRCLQLWGGSKNTLSILCLVFRPASHSHFNPFQPLDFQPRPRSSVMSEATPMLPEATPTWTLAEFDVLWAGLDVHRRMQLENSNIYGLILLVLFLCRKSDLSSFSISSITHWGLTSPCTGYCVKQGF